MLSDLKYTLRQIWKNPGFVAVAVFTLALGIGANTAVFSVINSLLLHALPVKDPGRLVIMSKSGAQVSPNEATLFSYPQYQQFRDQSRSLQDIALTKIALRKLVATGFGGTQIEVIPVSHVSGNFFQLLGVKAALGRTLLSDDDRAGHPRPTAVISYAYWQSRFASDPAAIGKTVLIDDVTVTLVGVAQKGFSGVNVGLSIDMWLPIQMIPLMDQGPAGQQLQSDTSSFGYIIGRLPSGAARNQAQSELDVIYQRKQADVVAAQGSKWSASQRSRFLGSRIDLEPGGSGYTSFQAVKPLIGILTAIVGLVFLVACANVTSLLLARGASRQRELAVRLALGARRGRLIGQLLIESLLLASAGGLLGLVFAQWGIYILTTYLPSTVSLNIDFRPDAHVLLFMAAASIVTGVLVGLIPALRFSRMDLASTLKDQGRGNAGDSHQRLNRTLVVAQIAVTVCLVAGAGLFVRTLQKLKDIDAGFNRGHVLFTYLDFDKNYDANRRLNLFKDALAGLKGLPGVRSASMAWGGLASGVLNGSQVPFTVDGYTPVPGETMNAYSITVGPGFLETLGISLLHGRTLDARDTFASSPSADPNATVPTVINETLAQKYFSHIDPIGRRLRVTNGNRQSILEVVGVAKDTKFQSLREDPSPEIYLPYSAFSALPAARMAFQLRAAGDPLALASSVPAAIQRIDPQVRVSYLGTLDDLIDTTLIQERVIAQLASFFSALALVLACIGLYGLLAYNVAQRTREIGVRMALGASIRDILGLVVRQGMTLSLIGCAAGMIGALLLVRIVGSLLYGVSGADPLTFGGTAVLLILVGLLASWIPARRAAKVDPIIALRAE
jgi:predicted permease